MIYSDDPNLILLANRRRIPTMEELTDQVNSLARLAFNVQSYVNRIAALESALASIATPSFFQPNNRALDTDFIIHASRPAAVFYTIELGLVASILGTATNSAAVDLLIDGRTLQSTKHSLLATIILGLSLTPSPRILLSGIVPPGCTVNLATTIVGTGTATLYAAQEVLL